MATAPAYRHRLIPTLPGLISLLLGGWLALGYPLQPAWMLAGFLLWSLLAGWQPAVWLTAVPALLPVIGLASWTGWLTFEEFDLLLLGVAAGGYARMALDLPHRQLADGAAPDRYRLTLLPLGLMALLLAISGLACYRGIVDAGGWQFGWFQGYHGPMNSLRLGKSLWLALLLLPLLQQQLRDAEQASQRRLALGMALGLAAVSLAACWERLAFPGLLDFSSDYRTTGLFWEMHVGGAALDGFLALAMPFAFYQQAKAGRRRHWLAASLLLLLGSYACLTTFSRGVYLAVPLSLAVLLFVRWRQRTPGQSPPARRIMLNLLSLLAAATAAALLLRHGGYRSLAGAFAILCLTLPLASVLRRIEAGSRLIGPATALLLGLLSPFMVVGEAACLLFALAVLACAAGLMAERSRPGDTRCMLLALAGYLYCLPAVAGLAWHGGGQTGLTAMLLVLGTLLAMLLWQVRGPTRLWPDTWRGQGTVLSSILLITATVAILGGGSYMSGRFSSSERDLGGRIQHWQTGLSLLQGKADWWLGKGLGRFPASYLYSMVDHTYPGTYRLAGQGNAAWLVLSGPPLTLLSAGELFRVVQRVPLLAGPAYTVKLAVRSPQAATLHLEVCEQHLLYSGNCAVNRLAVPASGQHWQQLVVPLDTHTLSAGAWYAPRLGFFAMAVDSRGQRLEIDNLSLQGPAGQALLRNGDFSHGMAHWFFVSNRLHLPWHIKNLFLHVLFDQGVLGLVGFMLLVAGALWRLTVGAACRHPLAPCLAASLVGFVVVGAFDSLLDVPRVGWLFYLLTLASFMLRGTPANVATITSQPAAGAPLSPEQVSQPAATNG